MGLEKRWSGILKIKGAKMQCKMCQNQAVLKERISNENLICEYKRQFRLHISLPNEKIGFYHCPKCDYSFFATEGENDISGSNEFYNALNKISWYYFSEKHEYDFAKQFIHNGDKVLEVGCGKGAFAKYIPQAQYLGLEFSTDAKKMAEENGVNVQNISIQEYAKNHSGEADVVCSFQVLEHVSNPHSFIQAKVDACRGGGVILIAVPSEDSFIQYAVNGILNMPPHHVGRFNDKCLHNIAQIFNLKLIDLYHEKVQPEHINFYKSVMFSKRFFAPKLLDSNPLRKITNRLGRFFEKIPNEAFGHTVIAVYQKL